MEKKFYYNFKPLNAWLVFNIIITLMVGSCFLCGYRILFYPQIYVLVLTVVFSWSMWYYKYIHPQTMAIISDDYIKIDHTAPLKWDDIDHAEEREVYCCFKKRRIIVLVAKAGIDYKYNWLQKHNSVFTPFSIPLYGLLSHEDEEELKKIVAKKTNLQRIA
ncbi:MAG: hypothetical protein IJ689_05645 [Alphaproteobacteria bacterium]|nr:hypothetical protein [Alphaproteobacteria bacterium]